MRSCHRLTKNSDSNGQRNDLSTACVDSLTQPVHTLFGRNHRVIPKILFRSRNIVVVTLRQLRGKKPGHPRIAANLERIVIRLQRPSNSIRPLIRNPTPHSRQTGQRQDIVNPSPTIHRIILRKEIGTATNR